MSHDFTRTILKTDQFLQEALSVITSEATAALEARGEFRLSLCGGSTPGPIFQALAESNLAWEKVIITFGDERCVPPDHERSNYRMARETLLGNVSIPEANVLRMEGELGADEGAQKCEAQLRKRATDAGEAIFQHDLILLGMGDDGHTASLFPGTPALDEEDRWVVGNYVPKFDEHRISFTYPLINAGRHVCFLLKGENKRPIYEEIFAGKGDHPAGRVRPTSRRETWVIGA